MVADVGGEPFHVGDEAMLAANIDVLRRHQPDLRITVVGRSAAGVAERYGVTALTGPPLSALSEVRLPEPIEAALAEAGGLFISGGGNLSSSWPDLLRLRIALLRTARRLDLPVVAGGQTIGPELTKTESAALAEGLADVAHLGVRELPSAALALRLGVPPSRLAYQTDDAFFLAGREPAAAEIAALPCEPYLAITLDSVFAAAAAHEGLRSLAAQLGRIAAESGLRLVFVPHVGSLGSLENAEGGAGIALRARLQAAGSDCALLPVMAPAATAWVTQRAALVVSSRYHPLVFGTAAGVPCVALYRDAYTRIKLQGALAHVGMAEWCLSALSAEAGGLVPAVGRLWEQCTAARDAMNRARPELQRRESERWQWLLARLAGAPESDAVDSELFGWPADDLAGAALAALGMELEASQAETRHWRGVVANLERSGALGGRSGAGIKSKSKGRGSDAMLSEQQWNEYDRTGYLSLGRVLDDGQLAALRRRADDLALGNVSNPAVQMQLDTGGAYDELPAAVAGFDRGTTAYRKIQGLETDEVFSPLVRHPLFLEACARQYGAHAPVTIFRAMVMNKPAGQGTVLPWHQDGGEVWALDRDPLITVWVALDPATRANGCLEVVPGTHRLGLLSLFGSTLAEEDAVRHCPPELVQPLEVEAGHALLMHNWLVHRSGDNPSAVPRRAFTACYMDGRSQSTLTGNYFPLIWGSLPTEPYPFVRQLRDDCAALRESVGRSEEFTASLEQENGALRRSADEAATYARSLEGEMAQLRLMREAAEQYARTLEAAREAAKQGWLSRLRSRASG